MQYIKKAGLWLWLLTKRLYKKPTFVALLALIPVLLTLYGAVSRQDSGLVTIALAREDPADTVAEELMEQLHQSSRLMVFLDCPTPEAAQQAVVQGEADGAWIFAADLQSQIARFIQNPVRKNAFVRVIEREKNVGMMLTREKLSGVVFSACSPQFYLQYIRRSLPQLEQVSDETLLEQYRQVLSEIKLFDFVFIEGDASADSVISAGYLMAPVRGLLALAVTLTGLASAMYTLQDRRAGTFAWASRRKQTGLAFAGQLVAVSNVALAMVLALALNKMTVHWLREVVLLLLFVLCAAMFAMVLGRLLGSLKLLGMCIPLLAVVMLVACPVFFELPVLRWLQYLFPPTYYIQGVYADRYILFMLFYAAIAAGLYWLIGKLRPHA